MFWPFRGPIHRGVGLGVLTVGIAMLQDLLARAVQHRLSWLDGGSVALTGLVAVRLLYQEPPPPASTSVSTVPGG